MSPNTAQTVSSGATVTFQITPDPGYALVSASGCGGTLSGTVTTGQVFDDCTVNVQFAPLQDTTPNQFTFIDQTNVSLSTLVTSNSISVSGINAPAPISITGGEYEINNSGVWSTTTGSVANASIVRVRQTSSSNYNTTTNTTLFIGGISDTFSVTTTAGTDTTPNQFFLIDQHVKRYLWTREHQEPMWFYLPILPVALFPWTLLPFVDPATWRPHLDPRRWSSATRFLVLWAAVVLVFFSLSSFV